MCRKRQGHQKKQRSFLVTGELRATDATEKSAAQTESSLHDTFSRSLSTTMDGRLSERANDSHPSQTLAESWAERLTNPNPGEKGTETPVDESNGSARLHSAAIEVSPRHLQNEGWMGPRGRTGKLGCLGMHSERRKRI